MERRCLKRMRSEDDGNMSLQTKMLVNQKIVDSNDHHKMEQIHEKTRKILFAAARRSRNNPRLEEATAKATPLWQQVILQGNGNIELRNNQDRAGLAMERRKGKCCQKNVFIQTDCINCSMILCEECGYSCFDCGEFLCRSCVSLFGSGTVERPLCEKCLMYS